MPAAAFWLTVPMVQVAFPAAFVVPVQVCAVEPDPNVMRTARPLSGVAVVGSSVVRWADIVNGMPLTAMVVPV